jgi:hypothetical protein
MRRSPKMGLRDQSILVAAYGISFACLGRAEFVEVGLAALIVTPLVLIHLYERPPVAFIIVGLALQVMLVVFAVANVRR